MSEGQQPAELGWGTHEQNFPRDGKRYDFGNGAAIYLMQPGAATRVRTWTPQGRPLPRLPDHARRGDLDRRLPVGAAELRGRVPADGALRLSPERFGRRLGARVRGPQLAPAGSPAHPDGRDHQRHRRARRAARRPQEERLLVRLAAVDRRGAQARAAQQRHQPAGHGVVPVGNDLGDGEPERRASSSPTRSTTCAISRSACRISAR